MFQDDEQKKLSKEPDVEEETKEANENIAETVQEAPNRDVIHKQETIAEEVPFFVTCVEEDSTKESDDSDSEMQCDNQLGDVPEVLDHSDNVEESVQYISHCVEQDLKDSIEDQFDTPSEEPLTTDHVDQNQNESGETAGAKRKENRNKSVDIKLMTAFEPGMLHIAWFLAYRYL